MTEEGNGRTWEEVKSLRDWKHETTGRLWGIEMRLDRIEQQTAAHKETSRLRLTGIQMFIGAVGVACAISGLILGLVR